MGITMMRWVHWFVTRTWRGLVLAIVVILTVLVCAWACGPTASTSEILGWSVLGLVLMAVGYLLGTGSTDLFVRLIDAHDDRPSEIRG